MAVKEIPTNFRVYYKLFIEDNKQKLEDALEQKEKLEESVRIKHINVSAWTDVYEKEFGIKLDTYSEFKNNKYDIGKFYRVAKGLLINKQNDYELVADLFNLFDLADTQKQLHDCIESISFYRKCIKLTLKEYTEVLRIYYTEVHKKLILEGQGYAFSNGIGWICVNRCLFDKRHPMLDYAATKKKEKELIAKGERIYNKEEAEWCARNGLDYDGKDKRVFVCNEYCYQIPLINCKLPGNNNLKLEIGDYRHRSLRGKSNNEIIEMCNGDIKKICELPLDLKTKVTLCDKADKILYTKFIRNENQNQLPLSRLIGKIDNDFNISESDWIPRVAAWTIDALSQMQVLPMERKRRKLEVSNRIAQFPCTINATELKVYDKNGCEIQELNNVNSCGCSKTNKTTQQEIAIIDTTNKTGVNFMKVGTIAVNCSNHNFVLDGNNIELNFDTDEIEVETYETATYFDDYYQCEVPYIYDNGILLEALAWYVLFKYLSRGSKHQVYSLASNSPVTNPYLQWNLLRPKAMAAVKIAIKNDNEGWNNFFYNSTFLPRG